MLVNESWGGTEKEQRKPFVGSTGYELVKIMTDAGYPLRNLQYKEPEVFALESMFITNVVPEQPPGNDMSEFFYPTAEAKARHLIPFKGLYPKPNVLAGVDALRKQILAVNPELIIGFGNYTLWALTDDCFSVEADEGTYIPSGIGQWRGSQLWITIEGKRFRFLPTYHPASVFRTWAWRYLIVHDLKRARKCINDWDGPQYKFILRPNFEQVISYLHDILDVADLSTAPIDLAVDIETRSKLISCIGLAHSEHEAICIPFISLTRESGYWDVYEELEIVILLRRVLSHPRIFIIGQNFSYDVQYLLAQLFVLPHVSFDTMLIHHLCWPGGGSAEGKKAATGGVTRKDLSHLSSLYCQHHRYWKDEGKLWEPWMGEEQHWNYNATDCVRTFEIAQVLRKLVRELNMEDLAQERMDQLNELALPMMISGVRIDTRRRTAAALELANVIARYESEIESLIPPDVYPRKKKAASWVTSSKQQQEIFYDILGIKPVLHRKTKRPSLGKEALPIIAKREPIVAPIVEALGHLRRLGTFHANTEVPLGVDGRMRCSFNVAGTETFRWSSSTDAFDSGTNLQNVSKGTEDDRDQHGLPVKLPNMRKFFVPDPGYEIAEFDLAGADAQVVAWEAEDEDLKAAFRAGLKLHLKNARDLYPEVTKDMTDDEIKATDHGNGLYYKCKRRVHATNYGASPPTLSLTLGTSVREEIDFQERWFTLHPGIKLWHARVEESLLRTRTVSNRFGYRMVYFDRTDGLLPQALAWGPQSTVAIACFRGALAVRRQVPWVKLLLQVHDSIVVQYPIERRGELSAIKRALHSIYVPYPDPLQIPWSGASSDKSWGEVKKIAHW